MIYIGLLLLLFATMGITGYRMEKHRYNNGICLKCDKPLNYFGTDSQGGMGYLCDNGHVVWISYSKTGFK